MRQKDNSKVLKRALKYIVIDKNTNKVTIYRYKKQVSFIINVSTRTLDRQIPYKNKDYEVYLVTNVVL